MVLKAGRRRMIRRLGTGQTPDGILIPDRHVWGTPTNITSTFLDHEKSKIGLPMLKLAQIEKRIWPLLHREQGQSSTTSRASYSRQGNNREGTRCRNWASSRTARPGGCKAGSIIDTI
jgi:hypothetical protein